MARPDLHGRAFGRAARVDPSVVACGGAGARGAAHLRALAPHHLKCTPWGQGSTKHEPQVVDPGTILGAPPSKLPQREPCAASLAAAAAEPVLRRYEALSCVPFPPPPGGNGRSPPSRWPHGTPRVPRRAGRGRSCRGPLPAQTGSWHPCWSSPGSWCRGPGSPPSAPAPAAPTTWRWSA